MSAGAERAAAITLANGTLELDVVPECGMTLTSLRLVADGRNPLWQRPGHTATPASRAIGPAGKGSIDTLHSSLIGGWFELSPHAGLPGMLDGRQTMLHGEASRLPWSVHVSERDAVEGVTHCVRFPLELRRRIAVEGSRVRVTSMMINKGNSPCSVTHGEHPCFSRAVFAGGSIEAQVRSARVLVPLDPEHAALVPGPFRWPIAQSRDGRPSDVSAIPLEQDQSHDHIALELARPEIVITTHDGLRLAMNVDIYQHPHVLLWRNYRATSEPSFGEWDVFAVEPQSAPGRGIDDAIEAGLISVLDVGERATYTTALTLSTA